MAWSHEALSPGDRALFNRLSVLGDSFPTHVAEAVASDGSLTPAEVLDGLARLVDKSLIARVPDPDMTRYRLLETLGQYGRARLAESGTLEAHEDRLLAWALSVAEGLERNMRTPRQDAALRSAVRERGNLRIAMELARERGEVVAALRLVAAVPLGTPAERVELIDTLIEEVGDDDQLAVARARLAAANLAFERGDAADAVAHARSAADLFTRVGDRRALPWCRFLEAFGRWGVGDVEGTYEAAASSLSQFRAFGDELGAAWTLWVLSQLTSDLERAEQLARESEMLHRRLGSSFGLAHVLEGRALIALQDDRTDAARDPLAQALGIFVDARNSGCAAHCLEAIAALGGAAARPAAVAELVGAAENLREISGHTHRPWELRSHMAARAALSSTSDATEIEAARRRGHGHDLRSAAALGHRLLTR